MGALDGRAAIVTGGGGVLGGESARLFARAGARVAVVDAREAAAAAVAEAITAEGGEAIALTADVRAEDQVRAAVAEAVRRFGRLDVLFNNAGVMPHEDRSVLEMAPDLWRTVYEVNVLGTSLFCKHAIPSIVRAGGGAVLNMSSFVALMGCSNPQEAYGASKGAVISLTRSLAVQFGPQGVRVNALLPGPVLTPHVAAFFPDEAARAERLARIPLRRFGRPEDVARAALFLVSDDAAWITGQAIALDGGISVHYL